MSPVLSDDLVSRHVTDSPLWLPGFTGAKSDESIVDRPCLTVMRRHGLTNAKQGYLRGQADTNVGLEFRNRLFTQRENDFGNVPVASRNAAWTTASNDSQLDKINFLVGEWHDIALTAATFEKRWWLSLIQKIQARTASRGLSS